MRIFIQAGDVRTARMLAEMLYIRQWGYINYPHDLHGHAGFAVLCETDTFRNHPRSQDIQNMVNDMIQIGRAVTWEISLGWLVKQR